MYSISQVIHQSLAKQSTRKMKYLLEKIIPGILKVGPEENARTTLVGGVDGGPAEADKEHGATFLHLLWSCSEEAGQVCLVLLLVRLGRALLRTVDEHPPFVVRRRSLVHHTLRHL